MKLVIGKNLREFNAPGSMGIVTATRYIRCVWPSLDAPVALFAEGSGGIEVQGPPTPRNIVFPEDTVALNIVVNDAPLTEAPRWRETDIPTKMDCYFTTAIEQKQVEVQTSPSKTVEVEAGIFVDVQYSKPSAEMKDVKVLTDLTPKQAREMAAVGITEASGAKT